jgi:hypothetical protein
MTFLWQIFSTRQRKKKKKKKEGMRHINGFSLEKNGHKSTHDEEKNVNSPYGDKRLQQVLSF